MLKLLRVLVLLGIFGLASGIAFWLALTETVRSGSVAVPEVIGRDLTEARQQLHDLGLEIGLSPSGVYSKQVALGMVATQDPHPGFTLKAGSSVEVRLSLGDETARVPELSGLSVPRAMGELDGAKLVGESGGRVAGEGNGSSVLAASPASGRRVPPGQAVRVLVNSTPRRPTWVMPKLLMRPLDQVASMAEVNGLRLGQVHEVDYPGLPQGTVLRQYPAAGGPLTRSDILTLWVSR